MCVGERMGERRSGETVAACVWCGVCISFPCARDDCKGARGYRESREMMGNYG